MAFEFKSTSKYFLLALMGGISMVSVSVPANAQSDSMSMEAMPSPTPIANEPTETDDETQVLIPVESANPPTSDALNAPAEITPPVDTAGTPLVPGEAAQINDPITEDDVFYDADSLVPEGQLARTAPRKMNPRVEPASKYIIVKKNAEAGSRHAQLVAASRAMKLGRHSSALEIYNELYRKNNRDPNILMGRAVALQKLGLLEESIAAYEELLAIRPKNLEARVNMLGLIGEQFPAVALRQLADLRQNNPNHVGLVAQMAITEARVGNFDSAIRYMGVAASLEPNNANHFYNMAVMADQAGAKREAVRYYEEALEVDTIYGGGRSVPREAIYTRLAQIR